MFKSEYRTSNQRLSKFVSEVGRSIGRLDQNIHWSLVQPISFFHSIFPWTVFFQTGVGGHVNSSPCQRQRSFSTRQTVPNFSPRTRSSSNERLYRGWEVVGFRFQGNHGIKFFFFVKVRLVCTFRSKLNRFWPFDEGDVILVGRNNIVGVGFGCLFDQFEQGRGFFFSIDDKSSIEN